MTGMDDLYNILLDFQAILVRLVEAILSCHLHGPPGDYLNMVTNCACAKIVPDKARCPFIDGSRE